MKFARIVFTLAGVWGVVVLTPLYWLFDISGRQYAAPTAYPHFFYGFISVAMVWQVAFFVIGSNPARFRPLMIPAMLEKFTYVATLIVLNAQGRVTAADMMAAVPDSAVGLLFIAAWIRTADAGSGT